MSINFGALERVSLYHEAKDAVVSGEKFAWKQLFEAMQLLEARDPLNQNFGDCCIYASRFYPVMRGPQAAEVHVFEQKRAQYLKSVLIYAREFFPGDRHAEQKFFELSQRTLRAIDPALIGEKRYSNDDWLISKIYKLVVHGIFGRLYMWVYSEQLRMWLARCDILKWGAQQDPETVLKTPLQIFDFSRAVDGFEIKNTRDQIISEVFYKEFGFEIQELKVLQTLFKLIPGEITTYTYSPSKGHVRVSLEKDWVGRPTWDTIDKKSQKEIPEVFMPIRFLLEKLKTSSVPGLSTLLSGLQILGSGIRIYPKQVRLEVDQHFTAKVDKMKRRLDLEIGKIKIVIPALGGDIYISLLSFSREKNGKLRIKVAVSGSNFIFNGTIKALTKTLTEIAVLLEGLNESSSSEIEIPVDLSLPNEKAAGQFVNAIVPKVFQWKV